jgi:hypothetical protein
VNERLVTVAVAVVAALALVVPGTAAASHDSSKREVFPLKTKVGSLSSGLANQGIRARLKNHGYKIRRYSGKCTRLSAKRRRCTYKFQDALAQVLGTGSYCSSGKGTTVRLIRGGKAISVGSTATKSC